METRHCKGQSYALLPVSLRRYSTKERFSILICISTVASLHNVDLKPLQTLIIIIFYNLLSLAMFVFTNYSLTDPRLQQHD